MADLVGHQFGNYRLVQLLGEGGFAEVYLGEHIYLKSQAAIKVMHTRLGKDDLESFLSEARTIVRLKHPNIVRLLEFGEEGSIPFLVMEYAPNGTLRQRHPKGSQLPVTTFLPYVQQLAKALQYAHEQRLVHRDIKPENMLLGEHNEILLTDFGIAIVAQTASIAQAGIVAGTVAYMAPEQLQGKPHPASDQYALGIVVYEWLTGGYPFQGSFAEISSQHVLVPPPPIRAKLPAVSPGIEQVVMIALEKDPRRRFATVQAFANALEQASKQEQANVRDQPIQFSSVEANIHDLPTQVGSFQAGLHEMPTQVGSFEAGLHNLPTQVGSSSAPTPSFPPAPEALPAHNQWSPEPLAQHQLQNAQLTPPGVGRANAPANQNGQAPAPFTPADTPPGSRTPAPPGIPSREAAKEQRPRRGLLVAGVVLVLILILGGTLGLGFAGKGPFATLGGNSATATPVPAGIITEYMLSPNAQPWYITLGPDHNLWFTENENHQIGHITPAGRVTEYLLRADSHPWGITASPDGRLWFTEIDRIGQITTGGTITESNPLTPLNDLTVITVGPGNNLWFTIHGSNQIGRITVSGTFTAFPTNSDPLAIVAGKDGNLWFIERGSNKVGRITPDGLQITEYNVRTANSALERMTLGPDGNVWFTEGTGNKIARIKTDGSGTITEFSIPTAESYPIGITAGPDGNLWFVEYNGDKIGRITPTGQITEYVIPTANSQPIGITAGPDGKLWFTEGNAHQIASITAGTR